MTDFLQIATTTDNLPLAEQIAAALVEEQLAACVQIVGPATSVYRWKGKVEQAAEWILTAKTDQAHYAAAAARISELHPYDCPEIVATAIVAGSDGYLSWLSAQLGG